MKKHDLVVKGGHVVLEDGVRLLDIGILDGIIVELSENIDAGGNVIDASGLTIMPGMIDIHVHFDEPNRADWEGFQNGSRLIAAGGITTYFDMPLNGNPPTTTAATLIEKQSLANRNSYVDYALWGGLVPGNLNELEGMAEQGAIGFKAFMSSAGSEFGRVDEMTLYRGMEKISKLNKVLALHAESEAITQELTREKCSNGRVSVRDYVESRPPLAEMEAVSRALLYAEETGCPLHFVHISHPKTVEMIECAKQSGLDVTLETCPHYLLFTEDDFERIGPSAKCAPPLRNNQAKEQLWEQLGNGKIDMITSDHSPCPSFMKFDHPDNMFEVWGGISGGQFSLETMVTEAHLNRNIPLPQISKYLSTNPAKRFGLYPHKGAISAGFDADLVLLDMNLERTVEQEDLLSKHPHSLYIGHTLKCAVQMTLSRGKVVYDRRHGIQGECSGEMVR
ncbi:allantoinase [Paenibacillus durus]|uniref:Allantoinase n=1 Tax=Paenibacillus durus TaxID=44251 RepID=A0A089HLR6_PAEDU|nr:allantoinase [Paenibacillus durus]AIQ12032.1 allantoinase [Paenibacillus durus]